jgi:hypothetical protein
MLRIHDTQLSGGTIHAGNLNPGFPNKEAGGPPEEVKLFESHATTVELEPGEFDDCFFTRFTISSDVRTLSITSLFPIRGAREKYCQSSSVFDLGARLPT